MELEKDIGRMVLATMVEAYLATLPASSLPAIAEWPEIHLMKMEEEMELMELWIEEVPRFDDMRASHKDLLSVQKRMLIDSWLALTNVQVDGLTVWWY